MQVTQERPTFLTSFFTLVVFFVDGFLAVAAFLVVAGAFLGAAGFFVGALSADGLVLLVTTFFAGTAFLVSEAFFAGGVFLDGGLVFCHSLKPSRHKRMHE
jgi:hypothetical protein